MSFTTRPKKPVDHPLHPPHYGAHHMTPSPKQVLGYNDPSRPRSLPEQIEYGYLRLMESLDFHSGKLAELRETLTDEEQISIVEHIISDIAVILGRNSKLRHKLVANIQARLEGNSHG